MSGGAVAYLTQSVYGRNKEEITINNYYPSTSSPYRIEVTGLAGNSVSASSTSSLTSVYAYNTENGMKASTTGNITGVYDLSGGCLEKVAGYISNGNSSLTEIGVSQGSSGGLMGATSEANPNGYLTLSRRDYTVYPYNSSSDGNSNNYNTYKGLLTSTYGYGDAILETSSSGNSLSGSWNNDYSYFVVTSSPFFVRGRRLRYWFLCRFVQFRLYVWRCLLQLRVPCGARCRIATKDNFLIKW